MFAWLAQEGPHATKHHGWAHPLAVLMIHYYLLLVVAFWVHDDVAVGFSFDNIFDWNMSIECQSWRQQTGYFLAGYALWLLIWRLFFCPSTVPRSSVLYDYTWLCNGTLVLGALACFTNRPVISTACCVTVGIDQLLWYVDLLGYLVSGKFPVGVAKYLAWPETTWITRVTCTHHLWTIPLLLTTSGGVIPFSALGLSFILMTLNVCLSRFMIPLEVIAPVSSTLLTVGSTNTNDTNNEEDKGQSKYLNVNLSHELWRDIKIELIQINYDNPPVFRYIFRLLWRWQGFNAMVFVVLVLLGRVFFAGDNNVCKA